MIEMSWRGPTGKASEFLEAKSSIPPFAEMYRLVDVEAVRLTDPELARAQVLFRDSIPMVYTSRRTASGAPAFVEDGAVTWFGDHARFIVANWR